MKYKKVVRLYSNSRVAKYYRATNRNKNKAVMLYFANMKIAQAFHPLLSSFEVILRNQLHYALAHHFSDGNWIINQKTGFMIAPSLTYTNKRTKKKVTNDYILKEVLKAEKKIADRGVRVTTGRVIAEQTLGFWNSFYETHHYALLAGVPCRIFKKLPPGFGRKEINDIIVQVRELRNRINHNEPICFVNRKCDFSYVKGMYTIISDFLTWIDPETKGQATRNSFISNVRHTVDTISKGELKSLQDLFAKVFNSIHNTEVKNLVEPIQTNNIKLSKYLNQTLTRQIKSILGLTNQNISNPSNVAELIYKIRCCIVHSKESEIHFTPNNISEYKDLIPVMRVLIKVIQNSIVETINNSGKKDLEFQSESMLLY